MSLCQYATILRKGRVTEYTSVNRKCDVQQPSWASCVHTDQGTSRKAQGFCSVSEQWESQGDARRETQRGAGWVPGQLSWESEHAAICLAYQLR